MLEIYFAKSIQIYVPNPDHSPTPPVDEIIAGPAISICAHFTLFYTNYLKNAPAVHPPPYLPHEFFKSPTFP